jgi:hypothetical protein
MWHKMWDDSKLRNKNRESNGETFKVDSNTELPTNNIQHESTSQKVYIPKLLEDATSYTRTEIVGNKNTNIGINYNTILSCSLTHL